MSTITPTARQHHPDDYVLWPDGSWAYVGDVRNGEYAWKSDDYVVIDQDETVRLRDAGILEEIRF